MLNRRTVNRLYQGFESPPLRSSQKADDSQCQEVSKPLEIKGDRTPETGPSFAPSDHSSVSLDDCTSTASGRRPAKLNHKQNNKRVLQDSELASVIDAWPSLPEPVKVGILAMVQASKP